MPRGELSFPRSDGCLAEAKTKERKVSPKASKVCLRFFQFQDLLLSSLKMYFFKGRGFDLLKEARNEAAKKNYIL